MSCLQLSDTGFSADLMSGSAAAGDAATLIYISETKTNFVFFLLCFLTLSQNRVPPADDDRHQHRGRSAGQRAAFGWSREPCAEGQIPFPPSLHAWLALCWRLNAPREALWGVRRLPGGGRAMPGQSMTSLAAATQGRAAADITVSPWLGQTPPNRLLVVSPLFMDQKKAWEKSRDPRPSLRTAEYCLHGNEGNKTANTRSSLPRQAGTHKSRVCNRKDGGRQRSERRK